MDAPTVKSLILFSMLVCTSSLPTKYDIAAKDSTQQHRGGSSHSSSTDGDELWAAHTTRKRSAVSTSIAMWPSGKVPYVFDGDVAHENILKAMDLITNVTCIKFVPRTAETVYVTFSSELSCGALLGWVPYLSFRPTYRGQQVLLTPVCAKSTGTILFLLGTTLGLGAEHLRPDRDSCVTVLWDVIIPSRRPNFYINPNIDTSYGPYDLGSIMHYSLNAESRNGSNTMKLNVAYDGVVGQREILSRWDILKIRRMYGCPVVSPTSTLPSTSPPSVTTPYTSWDTLSSSDNFSSDVKLATPISPSPSISLETTPSVSSPHSGSNLSPESNSFNTISPFETIDPLQEATTFRAITSSWTTVSQTATTSLLVATSVAMGSTPTPTVPSTHVPISTTPVPTMTSNELEAIDPNTLVSGSNIGLKILFTPNNNFYWIGCTATSCMVKNCPGNRFKPDKIALCPEYVFIISRTDGGSVIRVGDTVSLMQRGGGALYCGQSNPSCLLSLKCNDPFGKFSTQLCGNQVLVIRALNKGTGQPIMNSDNVVLDFLTGSLPVAGWMDNMNCHSEANGSCDRRYCYDNSVLSGNTTLATMSSCRQLFTVFKLS